MSATETPIDAAGLCADLVRSHDFARYAATLFMPAIPRRALLAVYAFNAEISRVREQVSQPLPGEMRLQWWTDMLAGSGHGGIEGNPVAAELLLAIRDFRLPVEPLSRLIEEHQFDLYNDPMPSMAALEGYVTDTSSALFSLAARIVARPSEADRSSRAPCRAGPGHRAGDRRVAARCGAAAAVRAAAVAGSNTAAASKRFLRASRRRARARRSISWSARRARISRRRLNCSPAYRRRCGRYSCRSRWSVAT